jgi:hypothetical protein
MSSTFEVMVKAMEEEFVKHSNGAALPSVGMTELLRAALQAAPPVTTVRTLALEASPRNATVVLFKPSGKYYTVEQWPVPLMVPDFSHERGHFTREVMGPHDMEHSKGFRRIDGGAVLVPEQEPWGYPHLFPADQAFNAS